MKKITKYGKTNATHIPVHAYIHAHIGEQKHGTLYIQISTLYNYFSFIYVTISYLHVY